MCSSKICLANLVNKLQFIYSIELKQTEVFLCCGLCDISEFQPHNSIIYFTKHFIIRNSLFKMNGKQTVFVTWFCVFLLLSCLFTNIDARKYSSSNRKSGSSSSSSSGHTSRPSTDSKYSSSHADQAKLSYSGYNSAPNPPKSQQPVAAPAAAPSYHAPPAPPPLPPAVKPSAPVDSSKPIGWNVPDGNVQKQTVHNTNAAPYPHQPQQAAAAPPPYSQYPAQGGAPPPYSPHSNVNAHPHDAPPPYQQHAAAPPQYSGGKFFIYKEMGMWSVLLLTISRKIHFFCIIFVVAVEIEVSMIGDFCCKLWLLLLKT